MNPLMLQPGRVAQKCWSHPIRHAVKTSYSSSAQFVILSIQSQPNQCRYQSTKSSKSRALSSTHDPVQSTANTISTSTSLAVQGTVQDLSSTRPAPLNVPEAPHPKAWPSSQSRDPSKWDFGYLFKLGKAYVAFYWQGVKNVRANWNTTRAIQSRISSSGQSLDEIVRSSQATERISYSEYEMILRSRRDIKKLIPFAAIFAVCGEFTPLIIVALGSAVVPATCVIPKQQTADTKAMLKRDDAYLQHMASRSKESDVDIRPELYRLGLTSSLNPFLYGLRSGMLRSRLQKHCNEVLNAAILVQREGGWATKTPQDMWEWGSKYGMHCIREYAAKHQETTISDSMKETLLKTYQEETDKIVNFAKHASPEMIWMAGFHSPSFSERPDCHAQQRHIEQMARNM